MRYRREVLAYIKENLENCSTMIRSETASTNDYFSRKMRSDRQDWAETTEIIATCCVYNINVHVLAIVPGRGSRASSGVSRVGLGVKNLAHSRRAPPEPRISCNAAGPRLLYIS